MGRVYEAVAPKIGKRVANKVLAAERCADGETVSRFLAEARAVNAIGHRNIVDVFGFGELADGSCYLVMEYLEGEPFDHLVSGRDQITFEQWMRMDLDYLDNWSLWRGLHLVLRTVPAVLRGRGAS